MTANPSRSDALRRWVSLAGGVSVGALAMAMGPTPARAQFVCGGVDQNLALLAFDANAYVPPNSTGAGALAWYDSSTACGRNAAARGQDTLAVGTNASTGRYSNKATALGPGASASASFEFEGGVDANATAVGFAATAFGNDATAVGANATALQFQSTAVGSKAKASDFLDSAFGYDALVLGVGSTALGGGATAGSLNPPKGYGLAGGGGNLAVGAYSKAGTLYSVTGATALGSNASAEGQGALAVGSQASAAEERAIAIGMNASASGYGSVVAGYRATDNGNMNSTVIGNGASVAALTPDGNPVGGSNVALGSASVAERGSKYRYVGFGLTGYADSVGEVAVGNRQVTGVAPGTEDYDAVNVEQLRAAMAGGGGPGGPISGGNASDGMPTATGARSTAAGYGASATGPTPSPSAPARSPRATTPSPSAPPGTSARSRTSPPAPSGRTRSTWRR